MKYLHESPIGSHGRLRSDLCFVTSRWVLKIGGAGLHCVRKSATNMDSQHKILRGIMLIDGYIYTTCIVFKVKKLLFHRA